MERSLGGWLLLVLLPMVFMSGNSSAKISKYQPEVSSSNFVGSFDPDVVNMAIRDLIHSIDLEQTYTPGLVDSVVVESFKFNITVRLSLWSPSCAMKARHRPKTYKVSGKFLKRGYKTLLAETFAMVIGDGYLWATGAARNLWIDYYAHGCYEKGSPCPQGLIDSSNKPARGRKLSSNTVNLISKSMSLKRYASELISSEEIRNRTYTQNHYRKSLTCTLHNTDSLISNDNQMWNTLYPGDTLNSRDDKFMLEMHKNCNIVIYPVTSDGKGDLTWTSGVSSYNDTSCMATLQHDGNFVVTQMGDGSIVWSTNTSYSSRSTNTSKSHGNYRFTLLSDGTAEIVDLDAARASKDRPWDIQPMWWSHSAKSAG